MIARSGDSLAVKDTGYSSEDLGLSPSTQISVTPGPGDLTSPSGL